MASRFGFGPALVSSLTERQIVMYLGGEPKADGQSDLFSRWWSRRLRCVVCDTYHVGTATECGKCGGGLRRFTVAEIGKERARAAASRKKAAEERKRKSEERRAEQRKRREARRAEGRRGVR